MTYVALLRGINVGGKNKVDMRLLKETFERAGMRDVCTYINSGNVIFRHESRGTRALAEQLERAIEADFGFHVKVLLRDSESMALLAESLPDDWVNGDEAKCDVMFLWDDIDTPDFVASLTVKPDIDEVRYVPGAVLWRIERAHVTRSGMFKLVGTEAYRHMTVRNCNTARRLVQMVRDADAERP